MLWISGSHGNLTCYVVGARSIRTERPRLRDPKRWVDDTQGGERGGEFTRTGMGNENGNAGIPG